MGYLLIPLVKGVGCVEIRIHFFKARITRINTVFSACLHKIIREIRVIRA